MFHAYVASVLSRYCVCLSVFCKCFIYLYTYAASVVSGCFKSRSGVAHGIRLESRRGRERPSCVRMKTGVGILARAQSVGTRRGNESHGTVQRIGIRSDARAPSVLTNGMIQRSCNPW
jgi:hypothetical protein